MHTVITGKEAENLITAKAAANLITAKEAGNLITAKEAENLINAEEAENSAGWCARRSFASTRRRPSAPKLLRRWAVWGYPTYLGIISHSCLPATTPRR